METLGDFLRHRREAAGLSLEDLAGRTRIRVENLRSLEREDLEALPTDTYVRGFVKLVCRELGLPPSDGLVRYESLRQHSGPSDEMTWDEETVEVAPGLLERALGDPERVVRKAAVAGRWAAVGGGAAVAVVLVVLAVRWIDPFAPRTTRPVAFLQGEAAGAPEPELVPIPEKTASTGPPAPATTSAAPADATPPPAKPRERRAPVAGERVELRLQALRPVQVSVLLDGVGHPRTRSLAAGETAAWKADGSFVVGASDGGAVRVFLGGRDLGPAGPDGAPVEGLAVGAR
jgi:cytoskeletal protein RodZ